MSGITQSRGDELRALSLLGFGELGSATGAIGHVQETIAGRVFRAVGPPARVVGEAHPTSPNGVCGALGGAAALRGRAADGALANRPPSGAPALSTTPRGAAGLAALNGLIGDELEGEDSPLCEPM